jgi:hypothetical protein
MGHIQSHKAGNKFLAKSRDKCPEVSLLLSLKDVLPFQYVRFRFSALNDIEVFVEERV